MKTRVCQPRKLTGGSVVGKEGDMYYAIKCNGLNRDQERRFKSELKQFVKGFCVEDIKEFTDQ